MFKTITFKKNDSKYKEYLGRFILLCNAVEKKTPTYRVQGYFIHYSDETNEIPEFEFDGCDCDEDDLECDCKTNAMCEEHDPMFVRAMDELFGKGPISDRNQSFFDDFNATCDILGEKITITITNKLTSEFIGFDFSIYASDNAFWYGVGDFNREIERFTFGEVHMDILYGFFNHNPNFLGVFVDQFVTCALKSEVLEKLGDAVHIPYQGMFSLWLFDDRVVFFADDPSISDTSMGIGDQPRLPLTKEYLFTLYQVIWDELNKEKEENSSMVVLLRESIETQRKRLREDEERLVIELQRDEEFMKNKRLRIEEIQSELIFYQKKF